MGACADETSKMTGTYDPTTFRALSFHDVTEHFRQGSDTPREYLERCLDAISTREPTIRAYVSRNEDGARTAADASSERWRAGQPLSAIDGMPVSIKDLLETRDMPTQMGCEAYTGNFPRRDNAAVWALREAGAVVLGKTVTAELGGAHPGPTTNPFDVTRTPGGSSSGSAAAVAAQMVPAAIGTQVGGSIIRPSGYCGNVALKPTQGGINRGERQATSMSTHGVHAGNIEDMWRVAAEIVARVGGDRGCAGLQGPLTAPPAQRPQRLLVLETEGWSRLDDSSRKTFEQLLEALGRLGIELVARDDHPLLEALEQSVADASNVAGAITAWENQWATRNLVDLHPEGVSERAKRALTLADSMSFADYRALLVQREQAQSAHRALAGAANGAISLSCPGPAPLWSGDVPGEPLTARPTGDAVFNYPTSLLFAPCVSMPLMAVDGMPVGVQLIGQQHDDARMAAHARWLLEHVQPMIARSD